MRRIYESLFSSLHRICTWAARTDEFAPSGAAMLIGVFQSFNLVVAVALLNRASVLELSRPDLGRVGSFSLVVLVGTNCWLFLRRGR